VDIQIIIKLHELIKTERTGPPSNLSVKLDISVRTVYSYLSFMKYELNAPIAFNSQTKNYYYSRVCDLRFEG